LNKFCLESFLKRWRVVQIETLRGQQRVKLSPSTLHTVFLGCLGSNVSVHQIQKELVKIGFQNAPIRLKQGNGNSMAFVDVPTYENARTLVQSFHGKRLLGSDMIRAEIEKSCAGKRPDSKSGRVYALLNESKGKIRLSTLVKRYKTRFGRNLSKSNNSLRTLIQMDRLLLFNAKDTMSQDIFIIRTPELGPKIVRNICACFPEGLTLPEFQKQLEGRLGQSLKDCDVRAFLTRWRFLEIRARRDRTVTVHLKTKKNI